MQTPSISAPAPAIGQRTFTVDRQTHLVAGLLLALGLILHLTSNSWWLLLAALPAFGLLLHASTGICPMSMLLERMPWNRR